MVIFFRPDTDSEDDECPNLVSSSSGSDDDDDDEDEDDEDYGDNEVGHFLKITCVYRPPFQIIHFLM